MASSEMNRRLLARARTPAGRRLETQSLDGKPVAAADGHVPRNATSERRHAAQHDLPDFWQHASDDHAVSTRITPIDATTCQVDVYWFVHQGRWSTEEITTFRN